MVETSASVWSERRSRVGAYLPGFMLSLVLAMAGNFISIGYGGPTILFALLLGMAFNFVTEDKRFAPGLRFTATEILRIGVALLGARITASQITDPWLVGARGRQRGSRFDRRGWLPCRSLGRHETAFRRADRRRSGYLRRVRGGGYSGRAETR